MRTTIQQFQQQQPQYGRLENMSVVDRAILILTMLVVVMAAVNSSTRSSWNTEYFLGYRGNGSKLDSTHSLKSTIRALALLHYISHCFASTMIKPKNQRPTNGVRRKVLAMCPNLPDISQHGPTQLGEQLAPQGV